MRVLPEQLEYVSGQLMLSHSLTLINHGGFASGNPVFGTVLWPFCTKYYCTGNCGQLELMHSWGFALREGVFAETKEGVCRNKDKKRLAVKFKESTS